jgi:hypothetical protein
MRIVRGHITTLLRHAFVPYTVSRLAHARLNALACVAGIARTDLSIVSSLLDIKAKNKKDF